MPETSAITTHIHTHIVKGVMVGISTCGTNDLVLVAGFPEAVIGFQLIALPQYRQVNIGRDTDKPHPPTIDLHTPR